MIHNPCQKRVNVVTQSVPKMSSCKVLHDPCQKWLNERCYVIRTKNERLEGLTQSVPKINGWKLLHNPCQKPMAERNHTILAKDEKTESSYKIRGKNERLEGLRQSAPKMNSWKRLHNLWQKWTAKSRYAICTRKELLGGITRFVNEIHTHSRYPYL